MRDRVEDLLKDVVATGEHRQALVGTTSAQQLIDGAEAQGVVGQVHRRDGLVYAQSLGKISSSSCTKMIV